MPTNDRQADDLRLVAQQQAEIGQVERQKEKLRVAFKKFDVDNSGELDRVEFRQMLTAQGGRRLTQEKCDQLFRKIDVDDSGFVSVEEFISFVTGTVDKAPSSSVGRDDGDVLFLENAVLKSEVAVLKSQLEELEESYDRLVREMASSGAGTHAEVELPPVLKAFIPIMKSEAIKAMAVHINEAEKGAMEAETEAERTAFAKSFRKIIVDIQKVLVVEIDARCETEGIISTCDSVIYEGNKNFENIYKSGNNFAPPPPPLSSPYPLLLRLTLSFLPSPS